ncbi:MAG: efflux RND transporter periplasmic adaptor subunit [Anaerolineales bacterium]|nr:efflux RND transporter periplasmic adaptor subunit [Anaerolineales bacterium]
MKAKFIGIVISLIALGMLSTACGGAAGAPAGTTTPLPTVISETNIVAEARVVPRDDVQLAFVANGQVEEVLVEEGDIVKKGDVLARLGDREQIEAAIAGAEAELLAAQQARKQLDDNLALAQAQAAAAMSAANKAVKDAQYALDNFTVPQNMLGLTPLEAIAKMKAILDEARERFEPYRYYPSENSTRKDLKEKLDTAQSDYNTAVRWLQLETNLSEAQTRLDEALKDYENLLKGPDADDVAAADARIKAAEENLKAAKANLSNLDLVATIDGTVVDLNLVEGQQATPGQPVIRIADLSKLYVETDDLTEIEVVDVSVGQKVAVVADALPSVEMTGVVEKISQVYEEKRGDITYTVRILLDNPDPRLLWGMTVVVTFQK